MKNYCLRIKIHLTTIYVELTINATSGDMPCSQYYVRLPDFCNHGWKLDEEGNVTINWMSFAPAPDSFLEFVNCQCKKGCENNRCSCAKAAMKCSDLCKCIGCKNSSTNITDSLESDSDTFSPDQSSSSDNSDDEN